MSSEPEFSSAYAFLKGGGEAAQLICAYDWSDTLGPVADWPQSLKSTVGLMVHSPVPMVLLWGLDGVMIYNDPYAVFAGGRHPELLGSKVLEGWPEVADFNDNVMRVGLAGGVLSYKDQELTLHRSGRPEPVWMDLDYSPVFDESGRPGGVIAVVVETTERVLAERRQSALSARLRQQFDQAPGFVIIMTGADHMVEFVNESHRRTFGSHDWPGQTIRHAFPSIEGQGFFEALDRVYQTGETLQYDGAEVRFRRGDDGALETHYLTFIYAPIQDDNGLITGIFCQGVDVTDAQRTVAALEASETRFRALVNATSDVIYRMSADWREMRELDGRGVLSDMTGPSVRWIESYILPEDQPRVLAEADDAIRAKRPFQLEHPVMQADGTVGWVFSRAVPILDETGGIQEWFGAASDVTERRAYGAALEESEARLRALFDAMDEGVMVIEQLPLRPDDLRDYRYVMTNGRATAMFGMPDLTGETIRAHFPDEEEFWYDMYDRVVATGQPTRFVHESVPQGMVLEMYLSRVGGEGARRVMVVMQDVTARRRAEQRLAESEARLRFLDELAQATIASQNADEILAVTTRRVVEQLAITNCAYADMDEDQDGFSIRGDYAAPGSASIVGRYSLAAFGRQAVEKLSAGEPLIVNDNLRELPPHEAATFQALGISATVCMPLVKNGRLTALMAIHDRAPRAWTDAEVSLIRDVAERSWAHVERTGAEAELRASAAELAHLNSTLELRVEERTRQLMEAEAALRQAQKMEAVGQLTGGIAHDFNNLLMGISGSLEMIARRTAEGRTDDAKRYVTAAQQAAERAGALTQRLLAFSRRQTLDPKPLDANRLVDGVTDLIERSVGPDVLIETSLAPGVWTTRADPIQLESALLNLCINARDAMAPDGGAILIATANAALDETAASALDLAPGNYVALSVSDTGVGMSPDVLAQVFEPFYTTKPLGQGTGLGLSMVYGFARQSGGQVRIASEVGGGTTVSLYLPQFAGPAERWTGPAEVRQERGHGERVMVVDDEPTVRRLVQDQLTERGYHISEAGRASEALAMLDAGELIDLLITDVGLPGGMNGRQLADLARVRQPDLKVLFITGYAETAVIDAQGFGANTGVLTKPFSLAQLDERVSALLKG